MMDMIGNLARVFSKLLPQRANSSRKTVYQSFEIAAAKFREKTAVVHGNDQISYSELKKRSEEISSQLLRRKAPPGSRVALFFENRVHAIAAMLAILRSGHAFVVLDTADPEERLRHILDDSQPVVLLTDLPNYAQALRLLHKKKVIDIQAPVTGIRKAKAPRIHRDHTAYICYTSGSTGKPKGVIQTHRNLLYFVRCYSRTLDISNKDRLTLLYSLSFSASNMDIFSGLLHGATVCAYDMRTKGIPGLKSWLEKENITVFHAVPTVFRKLTSSLDSHHILNPIRIVDLGGETVTARDVQLFKKHFPEKAVLVNHLAATEASVIAQYKVHAEKDQSSTSIPVGECPEHMEVFLENKEGQSAAAGEHGRIVIKSPHLSTGYWNQPELTEKSFANDPCRQGWRIFRTEDTGWKDTSGLLHFMGRVGTRIKIRGQSVDLSEVESALLLCQGIQDCAVVQGSHPKDPESDVLIAHVVIHSSFQTTAESLRKELSSRLPHYMLPAYTVFAEKLPFTSSGKIDRLALRKQPLPDPSTHKGRSEASSDPLESSVHAIFRQVLKTEAITGESNFFLMGGDSMSVVDLQILLSDLARQNIPLAGIFENPSITGICHMIRQILDQPQKKSPSSPLVVPLNEKKSGNSRPPLFLIHGRLGQANVSPHFIKILGEKQPFYGIQARGLDGREEPDKTVEQMAESYVKAIQSIQPSGPYFLGGLCVGGHIAARMANLLIKKGEKVLPLFLIDPTVPPFARPDMKKGTEIRELEHGIKQRLYAKTSDGRFQIEMEDSLYEKAAIKVAISIQDAFTDFVPGPYQNPVCLLLSGKRLSQNAWGNPVRLKSCYAGEVTIIRVSDTHRDIFDVRHSTEFARHVEHSLKAIFQETDLADQTPASSL